MKSIPGRLYRQYSKASEWRIHSRCRNQTIFKVIHVKLDIRIVGVHFECNVKINKNCRSLVSYFHVRSPARLYTHPLETTGSHHELLRYYSFCYDKEIHRLCSMDLKIYSLEIKNTTVTRQLTKSRDFCQNYLCDFHLMRMIARTGGGRYEVTGNDHFGIGFKVRRPL